jgi:hypothetical protein
MIVVAFGGISDLGDAVQRPGYAVSKVIRRVRLHLQSSMGRMVKDVPLPARFSSKPASLNGCDSRLQRVARPMR